MKNVKKAGLVLILVLVVFGPHASFAAEAAATAEPVELEDIFAPVDPGAPTQPVQEPWETWERRACYPYECSTNADCGAGGRCWAHCCI